ncbi:ATP-binding cassette domain-containing protein [Marinactinospora rubrisoli]|uniref:ATP-binding cassette domain-containing protein n=1 Tax=Marinactinospora rubrisoli TaxID=2715399 RepID=A0ABW2KCI8_9ACTN
MPGHRRGVRVRQERGRGVGLVLQDALVSLDPLRTVGAEVAEPLRVHRILPRDRRAAEVVRLLDEVGVPDPGERAAQHPHELSGGLRQRALIASALAARPAVLVADEPTTALDVVVQDQVLRLLGRLRSDGLGLLLISHDLAVVARIADRIAVMHDGRIVEEGPTARILDRPAHPRTRALLAAVPGPMTRGRRLSDRAAARTATPTSAESAAPPRPGGGAAVLACEGVTKVFAGAGHPARTAVRDVSLRLAAGEALGVVGESGSGKSTLAPLAMGLLPPDSGTVTLEGRPWSGLPERARRPRRSAVQLVQQDPLSSFDPRYPVGRVLDEALRAAGERDRSRRRARAAALLAQVDLDGGHLRRRPVELSGGQRQRVAIARALAPRPRVLVCDEPVSALDASVQAQITDLLPHLRGELGLALLFISHDLGVVHHLCDRVVVMRDGAVVEEGPVERVWRAPAHPHTERLLAAVPGLPPGSAAGERPHPAHLPGAT